MSRATFTRAMRSMPSFRRLAFAYVQAFQEQVMVSAACNGAHSLKERLARWLLMMRDRSDDDTLTISQDLLADMLGVQRPSITNAAAELERAGLIQRGREQVTIVNRKGLMIRALVFNHEPYLYRYLPELYGIVLNLAPCLEYLEPAHSPDALARLADCSADGVITRNL